MLFNKIFMTSMSLKLKCYMHSKKDQTRLQEKDKYRKI